MLNTQVAYWANVETKRHNMAMEQLDASRLDEQVKFWARQIAHWQNELSETTRHNLVTEGYSAKEIGIKQKQAKAALQQAQAALKNAETSRRDLVNKATQAQASYRQSTAALHQAETASKRQEVDATRALYQNAVDMYNMLNTLAKTAESKAKANEYRKAAEKLEKEIQYYEYNQVIRPTMNEAVNNAAKLVDAAVPF